MRGSIGKTMIKLKSNEVVVLIVCPRGEDGRDNHANAHVFAQLDSAHQFLCRAIEEEAARHSEDCVENDNDPDDTDGLSDLIVAVSEWRKDPTKCDDVFDAYEYLESDIRECDFFVEIEKVKP